MVFEHVFRNFYYKGKLVKVEYLTDAHGTLDAAVSHITIGPITKNYEGDELKRILFKLSTKGREIVF